MCVSVTLFKLLSEVQGTCPPQLAPGANHLLHSFLLRWVFFPWHYSTCALLGPLFQDLCGVLPPPIEVSVIITSEHLSSVSNVGSPAHGGLHDARENALGGYEAWNRTAVSKVTKVPRHSEPLTIRWKGSRKRQGNSLQILVHTSSLCYFIWRPQHTSAEKAMRRYLSDSHCPPRLFRVNRIIQHFSLPGLTPFSLPP